MEILCFDPFFNPFDFENLIFQPVCPRKSVFSARLAAKIVFFNPFGHENTVYQPVYQQKKNKSDEVKKSLPIQLRNIK